MQRFTFYRVGLYAQSLLYLAGGINHLWNPAPYLRIMPSHYTDPAFWVGLTGVAEIAGAVGLLLPKTRRAAAWGIILMLLGYFEVHIFMLTHAQQFARVPYWALVARLPLQFVLIAWAWLYTRRTGTVTA